jgi:trehalose 6-phosphate phosphatase
MSGTPNLSPPPSLSALCAEGPVAVFLDFDGTLVEIASTPDSIKVPVGLGKALQALSDRLAGRFALISGRAIEDIERHTGKLAIARAGSHGADRLLADGSPLSIAPSPLPDEVRAEIAHFASVEGFSLEEKPHGAALHYRADPSLENPGLAFAAQLAHQHKLAVKRGKCVIELVQPGADKGSAVRAYMGHIAFMGAFPLFIGDDVTDEDGFTAVEEFGGAGILVGDRQPTQARWCLEGPKQVHEWLGL